MGQSSIIEHFLDISECFIFLAGKKRWLKKNWCLSVNCRFVCVPTRCLFSSEKINIWKEEGGLWSICQHHCNEHLYKDETPLEHRCKSHPAWGGRWWTLWGLGSSKGFPESARPWELMMEAKTNVKCQVQRIHFHPIILSWSPAKDDESVWVREYDDSSKKRGNHQQDLRQVEAPPEHNWESLRLMFAWNRGTGKGHYLHLILDVNIQKHMKN